MDIDAVRCERPVRSPTGGTDIGRTDSAKEVDGLRRWFRLDGDTLSYNVRMAAVGIPLRHHLAAVLHRKDA